MLSDLDIYRSANVLIREYGDWHIDAIAWQLLRCKDGEVRRLLITQPPRSLKSICTSVALVAWMLGHDPAMQFIVVSYSDKLATDLANQFRLVVESEWYRALFPRVRASLGEASEIRTEANEREKETSDVE